MDKSDYRTISAIVFAFAVIAGDFVLKVTMYWMAFKYLMGTL